METPLLPIGQSYLRSSERRTNLDPALHTDQQGQSEYAPHSSSQQHQQQLTNQDHRVASGPAAYDGAQQSHPPQQPNQSKIYRHYGVGNNDTVQAANAKPSDADNGFAPRSGGGTYDPHYIPPQLQSPLKADWAQQNHQHQRTLSDDTDHSAMTSPLPPSRPLPAQLRNGRVVPEKVARHFDDMSPVQGHSQDQSQDTATTKQRGSSFGRMIRRVSGTEGKSVWRTDAERLERRERSTSRAQAEQEGERGGYGDAASGNKERRATGEEKEQEQYRDGGKEQYPHQQRQQYEQRQQQHLKQQQQPQVRDDEGEGEGDDDDDDDGGVVERMKRKFKLFG